VQKLYCYVDETGQDTAGKLYLVSVVIPEPDRSGLKKKLKIIERLSGKRTKKWTKATREQRLSYISQVIKIQNFVGCTYYSKYDDTKAYVDLTILTTAKAILEKAKSPYSAVVFVDGLRRSERNRFGAGLRKLQVKVSKVRGIRDEANEFIRLADAIAGFIRDCLDGDKEMRWKYKYAVRNEVVIEI
jgi:hypothetical protein